MKRYFDFGLFKAAFIRMKRPASVLFIINLAVVVLPVIKQLISPAKTVNYSACSSPPTYTYTAVSASVVLLPLLLVMLFAPILISSVFSFLKSRNATDFYHSAGHSKTQLFFSFSAACLVQILAFFVFFFLLALGLWSLPLPHLELSQRHLLTQAFFSNLIITLFLWAASLLACILTGRKFSCFIVTVLLATLPLYCCVYTIAVSDIIPSLPLPEGLLFLSEGDSLLEYTNGIPYVLVTLLLGILHPNDLPFNRFFSASDLTVLGLLAAVFSVLAFFVYKNRKSESSGNAFISASVSYLVRIGVTLPFAISVTLQLLRLCLYAYGTLHYYPRSSLIPSLLIFTVVFCFLASLIISRRFKKALVSFCVSLLQIIVLCVAVFVSLALMRVQVLSFAPSADNVTAVYMEAADAGSYEKAVIEQRFSTDPELIDMICKQVNYENQQIKTRSYFGGQRSVNVKLRLKGGVVVSRVCGVSESSNFGTLSLLVTASPYDELLTKLPEGRLNTVSLVGSPLITDDFENRIYEAFLRDYKKASAEERKESKTCANNPSYHTVSIRTDNGTVASFAVPEGFEECNAIIREYVFTEEQIVENRKALQRKVLSFGLNGEEPGVFKSFSMYAACEPELSLYGKSTIRNALSLSNIYSILINDGYFLENKAPDENSVFVCLNLSYSTTFFYADRRTVEQIYGTMNAYFN